VEVEHRAFGFALGGTPLDTELQRRGQKGAAAAAAAAKAAASAAPVHQRQPSPQQCGRRKAQGGLRCRAADRQGDWGPRTASEVLDGGAASMWYTHRKGSGVFFRTGRTMVGVGKLQVLVRLLLELATSPTFALSPIHTSWTRLAERRGLFAAAISGAGAFAQARQLNRTAHGLSPCEEAGINGCRCGWFLDDWWDDSLVWLGRSLGYESLAFVASAVSQGPCSLRREGAAIGTPPPAGHRCRRVDPPLPLPGEVSPRPAAIEECEAKVRTLAERLHPSLCAAFLIR
jgi:hypothetical protein